MENGNYKWRDIMDVEMAQIKDYGVFKDCGNEKERPSLMFPLDTRRSEFTSFLQFNTVESLRSDWLLIATSLRNQ